MNEWAVVTVATRNYFHFTRALAHSLRKVHPDAAVVACLIDRPRPPWGPENESFRCIYAEDLGIPHWRRFLFQYSALELSAALKSHVLHHMFQSTNLEKLLFCDADILILSSLTPLLKDLDNADIILTPQMSEPRSVATVDKWEKDILNTGAFNAGFIGLRRSENSSRMLTWWMARVRKTCKENVNFYEQGWLNAVTALFDGVHIERGCQFNLSPLNLHGRVFGRGPRGELFVDGQEVGFFHFLSINPFDASRLSRCSRQPLSVEPEPIQQLFFDYIRRLHDFGLKECMQWGYEYDCLADGTKIRPEWRELIRLDHPALRDADDPFGVPASTFRRLARKERWSRIRRHFGDDFKTGMKTIGLGGCQDLAERLLRNCKLKPLSGNKTTTNREPASSNA